MRIALAGNPNVGKSTVFNNLTGMHQHTGNWIGKTVSNAKGYYLKDKSIEIFDLPGTYSLNSSSLEEEVARDFICFGSIDACVIVCDALCLERNLNLVIQILEINSNVLLCVNMMDEARKKGVNVNISLLSSLLSIPVVGVIAKRNIGLDNIINSISFNNKNYFVKYCDEIEDAVSMIIPLIKNCNISLRWLALKLISNDDSFKKVLYQNYPHLLSDKLLQNELILVRDHLESVGIDSTYFDDLVATNINLECKRIADKVVTYDSTGCNSKTEKIDKILTSKVTGIPIMFLGLMLIFWVTIVLSNYPSEWLFSFFGFFEKYVISFLNFIKLPNLVTSALIDGVYRVLTWVISVMLPPMAIFFPIFTLLEDIGYLPRVAFTLDNSFRKCSACGKQSLTMAMGFGCNAVGVSGARIIDSPRERLIAILTNVFVPCNGRFPTIIMLISMFLVSGSAFYSSLLLTVFIVLGIVVTFLVSFLLSKTLLKGEASSFILELPSYRKPVILKTIVRSIFDRTLIILSKAIKVSSLAGLVIWVCANISINNVSLLNHLANFLNGFGHLLGLDGAIIVGFIFGFPANEIVFPIILMIYMSSNNISALPSLDILRELLVSNGWTIVTAISMILFCLFHFPCSTTFLTIRDETHSYKWALVGFLLPTIIGMLFCFLVNCLF